VSLNQNKLSFIGWPRWLTNPLNQHMVN
jgi:hypothetical protein